jgi:hypothetical protein
MKSFKQFIQERNDLSFVHDDAIIMRLRDFIDALELLDDQKSDEERLVEIREDVQEPGTYTVRLVPG